ncbi:MAG: hypothetical protein IPN90_09700 [Elusimicrobia bacterium]|nr:hypothetical protein [Elusimicrobiota bacterium]
MRSLPAVLAAIFFGAVVNVHAKKADTFEFLRLPSGARTSAMGGAGAAEAKGLAGAHINPAGLGRLWRDEISFTGARWIDDAHYQSVGMAHPFARGGAVAGSILSLDYGDISGYGPTGGAEGQVSARDAVVRLGYGRSAGDRLFWGLQGSYATETLADETDQGTAGDGGILWVPFRAGWFRTLTVGGAFHHWGKGPQNVQAGVNLRPFFEGMSLSVDGQKSPGEPISILAGAEYWARGAVALRLGYNGRTAKEGSGVSMGFGFRAWDLDVDYAFIDFGSLGETHHVGLTYRFGSVAEQFYERGLVSLQRKDYAQAVVHFARAISLNPQHRRALARLHESNEFLQKQLHPRTP